MLQSKLAKDRVNEALLCLEGILTDKTANGFVDLVVSTSVRRNVQQEKFI